MSATQIIGMRISRRGWGLILLFAAVFAVLAAVIFEAIGLVTGEFGSLSFISAVVLVKLGLFAFWPVLVEKGAEASTVIHAAWRRTIQEAPNFIKVRSPHTMQLWNERDPRIDIVCFHANVPSFVLNHEQYFLDWNPAFDLIFGKLAGMRRGAHVRVWYGHLDNFRRVAKRTEKLYGEGILPLTDRERVCFDSSVYGRMVFTRMMSPIIDRQSARIVGWNVVLNINSINKREAFFEQMFRTIAFETRRLRHAAGIDGLLNRFPAYNELIDLHAELAGQSYRVLDLGAQTGNLAAKLLARGHKVTAVDQNTPGLRNLRDKCANYAHRLRVVRRDPSDLRKLPSERYDAAAMMLAIHKVDDPLVMFKEVHRALVSGGKFAMSFILPMVTLEGFFEALRGRLEANGHFDALKHQFSHVLEHERELAVATSYRYHSRDALRAYLIEAGFEIEDELFDLVEGKVALIVARKS